MRYSFDQRIARARELAQTQASARELLEFYAHLAGFQKRIFDESCARGETDPESLAYYYPHLMALLRRIAPPELLEAAGQFENGAVLAELLRKYWNGALAQDSFCARVLIQPFAESLASRGQIDPQWTQPACPFCTGQPGWAVLRGEGDGGKRSLVCGLCATEWLFRRILCPHCGEENKDKLPVYIAEEFAYIRVEACDSCQSYIKTIDLTTNGRAIPVVDELASVPLNIWAEEHGYMKIAPNLLGM